MKYQLLWAACFVGLLQLSAVASRSTVDEEIINKENAKYSTTTVGPTVAYTGQEVERGVNSSDKLAVDPGPMSYTTYYYRSFDYPLLFICLSAVFVVLSFFGGCILMFWRAKKIRPGLILNHNPGEAQRPQTATASSSQDSGTQQLPIMYRTVQYAGQPQPVLHYPPVQQPQPVPHQHQPVLLQSRAVPSTSQAGSHQAPPMKTDNAPTGTSVVEFSNPICSVGDSDEK